jgi:hypothetical protein
MPTHRGVVIRADHSGFGSAAGRKRLPAVVYRAVLADKVFKGSLESVMQQIDDALGSKPTAHIPVRLPPPSKTEKKPASANGGATKPAAAKPAATKPKPAAKRKSGKSAKKKASRA